MRGSLVRIVSLLVLLPLLSAGCSGAEKATTNPDTPKAIKTIFEVLAERATRANESEIAQAMQRARVRGVQPSSVKLAQESKPVAEAVKRRAPFASTEDQQAFLKAACQLYDAGQYSQATTDDTDEARAERRTILRSQGETDEARVVAILAIGQDIADLRNGVTVDGATKVAVALECLLA